MKQVLWLLALLPACASAPQVVRWGQRCMDETDPHQRLGWVQRIIDTRDKRAIPVLIDCLEDAKRNLKKPDRDYDSTVIKPLTHGPELWGLYVLTGKDFDRDIQKWRNWWIENHDKLEWDAGRRGFRLKE